MKSLISKSPIWTLHVVFVFAFTVSALGAIGFAALQKDKGSSTAAEIVISDATTSAKPSSTEAESYIFLGMRLPYANPRSVQIQWPISEPIDSATQGTSTFAFWALARANPITRIWVNGRDAGAVHIRETYDWVTIDFPTNYLDRGKKNTIEIRTDPRSNTDPGVVLLAASAPSFDDVKKTNAFVILNHIKTAADVSNPDGGKIYARITVRIATDPTAVKKKK